MQTYTAKLKTRKQLKARRYMDPNIWGWWADVCPEETLQLRDATDADIARCSLREDSSRDPKDWLCELPTTHGCLVARSAVSRLTPNRY